MARWVGDHWQRKQERQHLCTLAFTSLAIVSLININLVLCNRELHTDVERHFSVDRDNYYHTLRKRAASPATVATSLDEFYNVQETDKISSAAIGLLLAKSTDSMLDLSKPLDGNLSLVLDADGPDIRPSRDYNDFKNISIDVSIRAWELLREHTIVTIRDRLLLAWPTIGGLLHSANASDACTAAIKTTLGQALLMDSWAIKLLNSWGSFPISGMFEGTYGDVGSFHTCVNIKDNQYIDHAHYCSVTFRPVLPSKKDYELLVRKLPSRLRKFNFRMKLNRIVNTNQGQNSDNSNGEDHGQEERDAFNELLEHAHYHHYVYYKLGTCWPIQCNPFDVKRITKLIARNNILLNGPVKCYSLSGSDYDEQYDEAGRQVVPVAASGTNGGTINTSGFGSSGVNGTKTKKLFVSVRDKNDGIFVWKPHFNRAHQIALAIIVIVTVFILAMTTIDLFCNKIPVLIRKLILSMKALPLDYSLNRSYGQQQRTDVTMTPTSGQQASGGPTSSKSLPLCTTSGSMTPAPVRKHPRRPGFTLVPGSEATPAFDQQQPSDPLNANAGCEDDINMTFDVIEPAPPKVEAATTFGTVAIDDQTQVRGCFMSLVDDCSILNNVSRFFSVSEAQTRNDISCLSGIRCITMVWFIITHTMMYNDWSAFARTRELERSLNSMLSQPILNGSHLVDSFFLMSGLLSAFTAFKHCQGLRAKFNTLAYIVGRWLRLTPQIFFVSMLYIVLPASSYGPHWFPIVGEFSENCVDNWWINLLHAQAFYEKDQMCNFVTWWISIDSFYHLLALIVIWVMMLAGHRYGYLSLAVIILSQVAWQTKRHYELALPPDVLPTIPQTGAMWTTMTLDFQWTPYTHSVPFFFGFYFGYLMALKTRVIKRNLNTRRALIGWSLSIALLIGQSLATYWWSTGKADWSRSSSTLYYGASSFIWTLSLCWIIIACQHDYGGFMNRALSWKPFIVLGKATYMIYLSHFQILFLFYGNQNLMLEPTPVTMIYIALGNILLSFLYGIFLCSVYELPWLKMHRRLMKNF